MSEQQLSGTSFMRLNITTAYRKDNICYIMSCNGVGDKDTVFRIVISIHTITYQQEQSMSVKLTNYDFDKFTNHISLFKI